MKVQSNVPMPNGIYAGKKASKYPFAEMKVGDSFAVNASDYSNSQTAATSLLVCAKKWCKNNDKQWKFSTKTENDSVRIWRVA